MPERGDRPASGVTAALQGEAGHRRWMHILPFLGPAFIACVAYIDPGNFATNIQGGAQFGYTLIWVIVVSNLMAMLIQALSAKLGIATGRNLPETIRAQFSRPTTWALWVIAEVVAMATDLAEFLVRAGMPFRDAHGVVGALVRESVDGGASLAELVAAHPDLGPDAAALIEPGVPVTMRTTHGGAGPVAVAAQLERFRARLTADRARVQEA